MTINPTGLVFFPSRLAVRKSDGAVFEPSYSIPARWGWYFRRVNKTFFPGVFRRTGEVWEPTSAEHAAYDVKKWREAFEQ